MHLKSIFRWLLAIAFIFAGVNHFLNPDFYLAMMPPYLPYHLELVYISGVFEALGGIGVLIPALRRYAGYGLIALLIAVFPANLQMLLNQIQAAGYTGFTYALMARLPLQLLMIAWVVWVTKPEPPRA